MAHVFEQTESLPVRPAHIAMALPRLGCHYPTRLSFMRVLTRTMLREKWNIEQTACNLNEKGVGEILYTLRTRHGQYTFVAFAHELDQESRTDRVIAERWDLTATLCAGPVEEKHLNLLRENVPKQEKGRVDGRSLVLTRGNQSSRHFSYVVDCLAKGEQPEIDAVAQVGYLYRTTAVYGSGKFGMCDWKNVATHHPDFNRPFAAEMFACFMLRQVSFDIAEHRARQRAPNRAVNLAPEIKRYFGIGNATGLGMAPFLVCHPLLINQWIECRELALARTRTLGIVDKPHLAALQQLLKRARKHLDQISTRNDAQNSINQRATTELDHLIARVRDYREATWENLLEASTAHSVDTQEILVSCLIEIYPELVDNLTDSMAVDEAFDNHPEQPLTTLKLLLEAHYDWALEINFDKPESRRMFWYRSAEKMEPRLGEVNVDSGINRQMHVDIARQASDLYDYICEYLQRHPNDRVAHFLIKFPMLRYIVRRVQTMAHTSFGEIRANLLDVDIAPTKLMRCKLSFFGASKFDPQSRLWVRNTMFQGAPILEDIQGSLNTNGSSSTAVANPKLDDWSFPIKPNV